MYAWHDAVHLYHIYVLTLMYTAEYISHSKTEYVHHVTDADGDSDSISYLEGRMFWPNAWIELYGNELIYNTMCHVS